MSRRLPFLLCALVAACAQASNIPDAGPDVPAPDAATGGPDADSCIPSVEQCDGDDDDCDHIVDNGCACSPNGSTQPCFSADPGFIGVGLCMQGTQTCVAGMWSTTCAGEVTPTAEICDGDDNDCDHVADDGNPGGGACSTGLVGVCAAGTRTCSGGVLSGCVQNVQPGLEICNGLDDDCNAGTFDGSAESWFNQACDGTDLDTCSEGVFACNGTSQACSDTTGDSSVVADSGYELGTTGSPWAQSSTNFGTPLCTVADCVTPATPPSDYAPHGGTWWNWLGGTAAAETSVTSQSMVIPVGTATLTFFLRIPACGVGGTNEPLVVSIDGTAVFTANTNPPDAGCGGASYVQKSVNVTSFANGASHTLEFKTILNTTQTGVTNYFVDDVRLQSCQ